MTGIADLALTPFSAGLVGGVVSGLFSRSTCWSRYGPFIWFAGWILLYTTLFAFHSEHPLDAIPTALGISGLWGIIPYAITCAPAFFLSQRLRAYIVSRRKR